MRCASTIDDTNNITVPINYMNNVTVLSLMLTDSPQSVIIDNTNIKVDSRKAWLDLAKELNIQVCVFVLLSTHQDLYMKFIIHLRHREMFCHSL